MESIQLQTFSLLLFLSLLASACAVPVMSVAGAVKSLSNSDYNSMALTLEFGYRTVLPANTLTIFAPSDTAFKNSGQPPLSLLHFHFSPLPISLHSLKNLPPGSKIPTFFSNHSLIVTSLPEDGEVSLNGVKIKGSVMFDDGSLVVFGTEGFFDPNFVNVVNGNGDKGFNCGGGGRAAYTAGEASGVLKTNGSSIMAAFLDLQVGEFSDRTPMTVFAPPDDALKGHVINFTRFRSVFLRHLAPCRISGSDLASLDGGVIFPTFLQGFSLDFNKSGSEFRIGGVKVTVVDMFSNDWIVVHGIQQSFVVEDRARDGGDDAKSSSERILTVVELKALMLIAIVFTGICLCLFW